MDVDNNSKESLLLHEPNDENMNSKIQFNGPKYRYKRIRLYRFLLCFGTICLLILMLLTFYHIYDEESNDYPKEKPTIPLQYEASVLFHMPYFNFTEPIYVHVDKINGLQRMSYYGGMDVFIFNENGPSYEILPVIDEEKCIPFGRTNIQHIFPDLTLFKPVIGRTIIRGIWCHKWLYETKNVTTDSDGQLLGKYILYTEIGTKNIIRFYYIGHNILLGGSHIDEYYIDYEYIRIGPVPESFFMQIPRLMNCSRNHNTHNIKKPLDDLKMLFPEGIGLKRQNFNNYQLIYLKQYNDNNEYLTRFNYFHQNNRYINSMNRKSLNYQLGINQFADLNHKELVEMYRKNTQRKKLNNGALYFHHNKNKIEIPKRVDWRIKGGVTTVKDQGTCGSCWAFGTTGALEGALYNLTGKLTDLSQQNLIDCSWSEGNNACDGGLDYQAYKWIKKNGGIEPTYSYGDYRNEPAFCHFNKSNSVLSVKGFANVVGQDSLNDALANIGPVSVSVDATLPSFYFYSKGIYDDINCKSTINDLDHSVLAVGYSTENDQSYTIIKNSWSTHWGEKGYMRIAQKNNICGVYTAGTYPILNHVNA